MLYRVVTAGLWPVLCGALLWRASRGKEERAHFPERRGYPHHPRPAGRLVWLHGASVGESLSLLAVIDRLATRHPDLSFLVTSGTVTSARVMRTRLPARACHQFIPLDSPGATRRFLRHWSPDLAIFAESELWPNLLMGLCAGGTPTFLINARLSVRSEQMWTRFAPRSAAALLCGLTEIHAQSAQDAERLARLAGESCPPLSIMTNLKYAAAPLPFDAAEHRRLQARFARRFLWLAASTHPGEEDLMASVHQRLCQRKESVVPLLLLAPRHPERGAEIASTLRTRGLRVAQRSQGEEASAETDVYLLDTMGEMGLWYALCRVVVMGGGFLRRGGQNPLEPLRAGCAVICGPQMQNFESITAQLRTAGCVDQIDSTDQTEALTRHLVNWRDDPEALATRATKARDFMATQRETITPLIDALSTGLPPR